MQKTINYIPGTISLKAAASEVKRSRIVQIVFLIYWLLILGGPLRKWVLPEFQTILFFIRLPFTALLYFLALRHNAWPRSSTALKLAYVLAAISAIIVPIQFILNNYELKYFILSGYGWISYFFYIPLIFIIAENFRYEDIVRLLKHTLIITILEAPLAIIQFYSNPGSFINAGSSLDTSNQFQSMGAALGKVRPTGFFSSAAAYGLFIAVSTIAVLYGWLSNKKHPTYNRTILLLASFSLFCLVAVSGSRGAVVSIAIVLGFTILASFLTGKKSLAVRMSFVIVVLALTFLVLWPLILPSGYEVFVSRWMGAYQAESSTFSFSFFGRLFYSFYSWIYYIDGPFFGYLLGIANNAASRLPWVQLPKEAYDWQGYGIWATESTWGVHLVELGIPLGILYTIFRISLVLWSFIKSYHTTKNQGNPLPLMIFSFAGMQLLIGQITVQGDVGGFTWIFFGLCLSAMKITKKPLKV